MLRVNDGESMELPLSLTQAEPQLLEVTSRHLLQTAARY